MEHLLSLAAPLIVKKDTNFRKAIPPAQRLLLTLRFLASSRKLIVFLPIMIQRMT